MVAWDTLYSTIERRDAVVDPDGRGSTRTVAFSAVLMASAEQCERLVEEADYFHLGEATQGEDVLLQTEDVQDASLCCTCQPAVLPTAVGTLSVSGD